MCTFEISRRVAARVAAVVRAAVFGAAVFGTVILPTGSRAAEPPGDLIGQMRIYVGEADRTLLEVAREQDLGVLEIMAANPGIDPWMPGAGTALLLPSAHVLPDAEREGIVINLAELRLYYFPGGDAAPVTATIGIGRQGFTTPLGTTKIVRKQTDPTWFPTATARAENPALPAAFPPGPANPLGKYAFYLGWETYLIHGTHKPYGVGRRVSRGCIRLYPERIEQLFRTVEIGTKVTVVSQPVKLGWQAGELYLEVHPDLDQLDELEVSREFTQRPAAGAEELILAKAGAAAARLDWARIEVALAQRLGIPVRITFPQEGRRRLGWPVAAPPPSARAASPGRPAPWAARPSPGA